MDMIKIGSFLSQLRRDHGLTQAQLGDRLGVSNKTVSRWETGVYLPPVECLQLLSVLYDISINELLSAQRLPQEEYRQQAEENIKSALDHGAFTLKEKQQYFKAKWRREHRFSTVLCLCLLLGLHIYAAAVSSRLGGLQLPAALLTVGYCVVHYNSMMAYVEGKVFQMADMTAVQLDTACKTNILLRRWRIAAMILLGMSLLVTVDLGYNYFASQISAINDGLTIRGIFAPLAFGYEDWSQLRFFKGFAAAAFASTCIALCNLVLACIEKWRQGNISA